MGKAPDLSAAVHIAAAGRCNTERVGLLRPAASPAVPIEQEVQQRASSDYDTALNLLEDQDGVA